MILRQLFTLLGFKVDKAGAAAYQAILKDTKTLAIGVSAAVAAVGAGIAKAVADFADFAGDTVDTATKIGTTTDALQELDYAAVVGGASVGAMREALNTLGAAASGVTARGKQVRALLAEIGVSATDSAGKAKMADVLYSDLTQALEKVENPGKRAAIAMRVLGGSGDALVPLLAKGADGLVELREEAKRYGTVISEDAVNAGDDLGDNLDRLHLTITGVVRTVASGLAPAFNEATKRALAWFAATRSLISTDGVRGLVPIVRDVANGVSFLVAVGGELARWTTNVIDSFGGVRNVLLTVAVGFGILNIAMLPAIAVALGVVAAFSAIALIIEDVALFEKYGDQALTLTGRLKKAFVDDPIKPDDVWFIVILKVMAKSLAEVRKGVEGAASFASDFLDAVGAGSGALGAKAAARRKIGEAVVGFFGGKEALSDLAPNDGRLRIYQGPTVRQFTPHIKTTLVGQEQASGGAMGAIVHDNKQITINVNGARDSDETARAVARHVDNANSYSVED